MELVTIDISLRNNVITRILLMMYTGGKQKQFTDYLRRLKWAWHVARMEEGRSVFKILTGKHIGKRPIERPRCRWEGNIRTDLEDIDIIAGNWVDSAQDRDYWRALVNAALNLRVP